jgi:protein-disulfide isomerase
MDNETQNQKRDYLLPVSIVIAGLLIAGAWVYSTGLKYGKIEPGQLTGQVAEKISPAEENNFKLPDSEDHILGSLDAPVKIVEYSDLECPFCKTFQQTMRRMMSEYGKDGKVAWIYRHYPLEQLHPKAKQSAIASECAGELGGNEKFWAYIDKYYEITPANNEIDLAELPRIAKEIGLDQSRFETCLNSGKYGQKIEDSIKDALAAGAQGTPYSLIITKDGAKVPISGAQPYENVKFLLEQVLR